MRRPTARPVLLELEDRATPAAAGTLDPGFGVGGLARLAVPPGATAFNPAAVAVGADGRVVVAGFNPHRPRCRAVHRRRPTRPDVRRRRLRYRR